MIIKIRLGEAYYKNGFIYFKKEYQDHFGDHDSYVNVCLGNWNSVPLKAKINRNAQPSHSPRLMMGSEFTKWIQTNYNLGEFVSVEILNPKYPNSILMR